MKKVFVLYICFCLTFSQNVLSVDQTTSESQNTKLDTKFVHLEANQSTGDTLQKEVPAKCSGRTCPSTTEQQTNTNADITTVETLIDVRTEKLTAPNNLEESAEKGGYKNQETPSAKEGKAPALIPSDEIVKDSKQSNVQQIISTSETTPEPTLTKHTEAKDVTTESIETKVSNNIISSIRINEVLANPDGADHGNEFIEIYNDSDTDISLENWCLHDKTQKCYNFGDVTIKSKDFLTLYNETDFSFSLNNSNEEIYLKDANKNIISEYSYAKSTSGLSWNYDDVWYEEMPTPNVENVENPLTKNYPDIIINELLPNPLGDEQTDEFIEIYNPNDTLIELQNWILKDDSTSGKYIFPQTTIAPHSYLVIYRSTFGFALNNFGNETVFLIAPNTKIKSSITYTNTVEGLSYNRDTPDWYWEQSTPGKQNIINPFTREYPLIYLNEILPNPSTNEQTDEFIEIYNPFEKSLSLKNWTLSDSSDSGKYTFNDDVIIEAKSYYVIYRDKFSFALNNSGNETISLIAPNKKIISTISYLGTREGVSLNRANEWYWAEKTPRKPNAADPRTIDYPKLLLSEILPNPSSSENTDEFIEIYNPNNNKVSLKNWLLKDASKTGSYTFTDDIFIEKHSYFVIYRKDFSFALNNSNDTISLIAPNEKITDIIYYEGAREDISYNYEHKTKKWRWSKYLTPKQKNIFNNLPTITKFDIDKKAYKNVYVEFDARANDIDNEKLKVRWDFGDGRKSYLWKTRHKYTNTGIYHGHLRIQDNSEEIIKNFTVIVKKYPKYKVKITQIVPNPAGKDSGAEFIMIKNMSNQKINLKNWSIATGSSDKTIVNHPVNKKLIIRPGKSKVITKKYAAISLPNKTGVIEIRRPNGSVADTREYGDKSTSIPDNASYEEINGVWQWLIPQDLEKLAQMQAIIIQALKNEQILSQQSLESYIAFDAIYNPHIDTDNTNLYKLSLLAKMLQKINLFINTTIAQIQTVLHDRSQPTQITYTAPLYDIPHTTNPCKQPTIFTSNNLHFCK